MSTGTFCNSVLYKDKINSLFDSNKEGSFIMAGQASSLKKPGDLNFETSHEQTPLSQSIPAESSPETILIARAQGGDKDAFKELFEKNYSRIFSAAMRMLGNKADAADLSQEAFLKAYQNLKSFKGNSSFYTWVYRILFNASVDLRRKSSRRNEISSSEDFIFDGDGSDPLATPFHSQQLSTDDKVYSQELRKIIGDALNQLSLSHRQIIVCREIDGLSYEEIGKLLKCSIGTVMSRLFHARKNLVNILNAKLKDSSNLNSTDANLVVDNLNI